MYKNISCSGCFFLNSHPADYSPERCSLTRKAEGSNHPALTRLRSHLSDSGCHSWGRVSSRRALSALTEPHVLSGPLGVKEEATAHFLLRTFSLQAWAKGKYRLLKRLVISIRALLSLQPEVHGLFFSFLLLQQKPRAKYGQLGGLVLSSCFCFDLKVSRLVFERDFPKQRCECWGF